MTEVPEHLLKRSQERRKALGVPRRAKRAATRPRHPRPKPTRPWPRKPQPRRPHPTAAVATRRRRGDHRRQRRGARASPRAFAQAQGGACRRRTPKLRLPPRRAAVADARPRLRSRRPRRPARAGRAHPAVAHGRQVRLDPAGARRRAGQGARLAAPARDRVRRDALADGVRHDLLCAREGAAARPGRREPDAEPVEGPVVLPRLARAAEDVPTDGRGRDDSRRRAWRCWRSRPMSTRTRRTSPATESLRSS